MIKKEKISFEVEYMAKTQGNRLSYDILSFDKAGNEIHIEVKTTRIANRFWFYMSMHILEHSTKRQLYTWIATENMEKRT